ncbi:MAG: type I DNA topoisomerase [Thermodesulfobacteriota bacterium]
MANALIIVESPAKAKTLQKYLGKGFDVRASVGHVRDLPVKDLGVDIDNDFTPKYATIKGKSKLLAELKAAAKNVSDIYLAPDPDREGEAIAWHIAESLRSVGKPIHRALFHELTKKAILEAISTAADINQNLFEAQQARRILDRLVGYQISPLLWEKVRRGLSAGRVQSVAVRMICDREAEIRGFVAEEYWTIDVALTARLPPGFTAQLEKIDGHKAKIPNGEVARAICGELEQAEFVVGSVEKKQKKRYASPPFITSTLQMDANRKLRFTAKKTMSLAQRLYEGIELGKEGPAGLITYMRTDSTRINDEAMGLVRDFIGTSYGKDFLPAKPVHYKTSKSAQDAHEAIRPTDVSRTPEKVAAFLDRDLLALYTLIWKRFVASQMAPALFDQTTITIKASRHGLKTVGSILRFPGFLSLYQEAVDEPANGENGGDAPLPDLKEGEILNRQGITPKQHFTQPPPRYTEASIVKALEENGVGRPSTYASIISTIVEKEYVRLEQRKFFPTDLGMLINELLVKHFPDIMEVEFTASMEKELDKIADGAAPWRKVLRDFYGPFAETLARARENMESVKRSIVPTDIPCSQCGAKMVIRWGKMGEFLACETYPACRNTMDFKRDAEGKVVPTPRQGPEESGEACDKCGKPMVWRMGRFGKFLACSGYPKCKNVKAPTTGVKCPEPGCGGEIIQKVSKRGKVFYGCDRYPKCKLALWDKPVNEPCPECGAPFLVEKTSKTRGTTLKCQSCAYKRVLGKKGEDAEG